MASSTPLSQLQLQCRQTSPPTSWQVRHQDDDITIELDGQKRRTVQNVHRSLQWNGAGGHEHVADTDAGQRRE